METMKLIKKTLAIVMVRDDKAHIQPLQRNLSDRKDFYSFVFTQFDFPKQFFLFSDSQFVFTFFRAGVQFL